MDLWRALDAEGLGEPRYVRFQPGRRLVVLYERGDRLTHLTVLRPRPLERLWNLVAGSPLASRELGGVLQQFPLDVMLPGLAVAARGGELVRYKPGRRAVIRYPDAYGKLRADGAGWAHVELAQALIAAGIATPAPRHYVPQLRMALYEEVHGVRLATLRGGGLEPWMAPVAEALERLHATPVASLRAHSMEAELEDLRAAAQTATALGADCLALAEKLARRLAVVAPRAATIHGSFHDDQVLVGDEITLLDLDSAAIGHPLLDVGHFASYLTAAGEETARAAFLEACDAGRDVLLFEAAALLRWSSLPFRDLEPGWPDAVARRIALAGERFADYERRSASSVMTAS